MRTAIPPVLARGCREIIAKTATLKRRPSLPRRQGLRRGLWGRWPSTAGYGPDDQERLLPRRDGLRQGSVLRFVGHVPPAGEKPDERPAPPRRAVADGPAKHRVGRLDRVDDGALGGPAPDLEGHRAACARKGAKVRREN